MEETLVNLETAKLAKEKGFKESCLYYFSLGGIEKSFCEDGLYFYSLGEGGRLILRPTQSLLQKWLREIHNIHVEPAFHNNGKYFFLGCQIINNDIIDFQLDSGYFDTYEKALEVGLQEALKLIKNK